MAHETTVAVESWSQALERLRVVYSRGRAQHGSKIAKLGHAGFPEIKLVQCQVGQGIAGGIKLSILRLLREIWNAVAVLVWNVIVNSGSRGPRPGIFQYAAGLRAGY